MKTGFWQTPDIDEALENAHLSTGDESSIFLHGLCGIFALALHEEFGYDIEYIVDECADFCITELIHVYCFEEDQYIDVRGQTDDEDAFMAEFEDFFVRYAVLSVDAETLSNTLASWMDSESLTRYKKAALDFIQTHREFYERRKTMSDVNFVLVYHENSDAACEATTRFFRLKENAQKAMLDDFCAKEGVADCPAAYYKDDDNFLDVGENSIVKQDGIDNYSWTILDACPEDPADAPEDPDSTGKRIFNLVIIDSGMDRMPGEDVWVLSFLTDIQDKTQARTLHTLQSWIS